MKQECWIDLGGDAWTLIGWVPNTPEWLAGRDEGFLDAEAVRYQCLPAVPAIVPGAVQEDLLRAGWLPDWNAGLNSWQCEWVEHRNWEYRRQVAVPEAWEGKRILLQADGLDYSGHVAVDGHVVGRFSGMMVPHSIDLTGALEPGKTHWLSIVLDPAPPEQGQIGYTSRSRWFKARFAYRWDWCPRMVPLGIWDRIGLRAVGAMRLERCLPTTEYDAERGVGRLSVRLDVRSDEPTRASCRLRMMDGERIVADRVLSCAFGQGASETLLDLSDDLQVDAWWPNGMGEQRLCDLEVSLLDGTGQAVDVWRGRVGFKQVTWRHCEGAPENAEPWICEVNGQELFLCGVNWTPIRMTYGSVTESMYRERLALYADAGMTLLRVWGGAFLEKEPFYRLCDEMGLMVWQEFPLSSSGVDNYPPVDAEALKTLGTIADSYVWRRGGHASLLVWSGGNELFRPDGVPVDAGHPAIAQMAGTCSRLTPEVRFVNTSPSGPSFGYDPECSGQGLHHDIHGPWQITGTLDDWRAHWDGHDAMLISEVGAPACAALDLIEAYQGDLKLWPPKMDNPLWHLRQPWWLQWDRLALAEGFRDDQPDMARYVEVSQREQAEALSYLVASAKGRFPACGGVMIWMGHDCFPCLANTSIVDYWARPKPALEAIKRVLLGDA